MFKRINWRYILYSISFMIILGLIGYGMIVYGGKLVVKDQDLILDAKTTIETENGEVIWELYDENRQLIEIQSVPKHVQQAFVAVEDHRFYNHAGVDFKAVLRAIYRDIVAFDKVEGASTITQQLAKNLFLHHDKTWMRKTKEVMAAIYLERTLSKDAILELYLNTIYFGHGIYGIDTASQYFYSKPVSELTIAEGALLAGLVKSPHYYSPIDHAERAIERRNLVLTLMHRAQFISAEQLLEEQDKLLWLQIQEKEKAPWLDSYVDLVLKEAARRHQLSINELKRGGYRIIVHLDEKIQQIAYEKIQKDKYFPGNTPGVEAAFVMMDQETGSMTAAIGGRYYQIGDLNRVTVKRQPGSVIKPLIVYAPALMKEEFHPFSLIRDERIDYDGYSVSNHNDVYEGQVTIYDAITKSKNTSAVWLLNEIGIDYAKRYMEQMDIDIADAGLAIALGGLSHGLSPLELVKGYRTFVHEGEVTEPHTISRIYNRHGELIAENNTKNKQIFSPQVAWDMTEILSKTVKQGTASAGTYEKALAGKTGTTEHPFVDGMVKDAWFVGYTPEYVTALWMGYDRSDEAHYLIKGSAYPTTLTKDILTEVDKQYTLEAAFTKPVYVERLPEPIELPDITNVDVTYEFGIFPLIKGKLTWEGSKDERVVYRIYREIDGADERIGEVVGESEFIVSDIKLFSPNHFYIVPYNPLTKIEGKRSKTVELSLK